MRKNMLSKIKINHRFTNQIKLISTIVLCCCLAGYSQEIKPFNPSLHALQNVRDFCISPNNEEAFFSVQSPNQDLSQIATIRMENGHWTEPELLPFCDAFMYLEPFLSYDGTKLYFASDRPLDDSIKVKKDFDIWYVERKDNRGEWSKPMNIGSPVNSTFDEFYPTLALNNNLYFTMDAASGLGKDDIYFCEWKGSEYSIPVLLNENINSEGYEFNAFISKDESFLMYTKYNALGGFGSGDLYISRKNENGEWQTAKNLGQVINSKYMEYCPFYDATNEILYFTSKRNTLTSQKFENFSTFKSYIQEGENGLSRIYYCNISLY
ncbi:MAG: hypothetical protein WAT79_00195 [Saprospiraceae bacterium]